MDLGPFLPGQVVTGVVPIGNPGTEPLDLRARASSPRLSAALSAARVPPGGQGELRIEYRPTTWQQGPVDEQVVLYSNDPDAPVSKVRVRGLVQAPIGWTSRGALPSQHRRGDSRPIADLTLVPKDGRPLGAPRVTLSSPLLRGEVTPQPSGGAVVRVTADPSIAVGSYTEWIKIETGRPEFPVIELPLRFGVVGDLAPRPPWLNFGLALEGQPATARITLANLGEREIRVLGAEPHLPVPAHVELKPSGTGYEVSLRLPSPPPLRNLEGYVDFVTDDPGVPVVRVPAAGWVRAKRPFELAAREGEGALMGLVTAVLLTPRDMAPDDFFARVLGGVRDRRAESLLIRLAAHDNWLVRQRAIQYLGELRSARAGDLVRRAVTDDPDEEVRRAAVAALVKLIGRQAVPVLLLALEDDDDWVRGDAAQRLGELGDPLALQGLRRALMDEDDDVRAAAAKAVKTLGAGSGGRQ